MPKPKTYLLRSGRDRDTPSAEAPEVDQRPLNNSTLHLGAPMDADRQSAAGRRRPGQLRDACRHPGPTATDLPRIVPLRTCRLAESRRRTLDPRGLPVIGTDGAVGGVGARPVDRPLRSDLPLLEVEPKGADRWPHGDAADGLRPRQGPWRHGRLDHRRAVRRRAAHQVRETDHDARGRERSWPTSAPARCTPRPAARSRCCETTCMRTSHEHEHGNVHEDEHGPAAARAAGARGEHVLWRARPTGACSPASASTSASSRSTSCALAAWRVTSPSCSTGSGLRAAVVAAAVALGLGALALGLVALMAWMSARTASTRSRAGAS